MPTHNASCSTRPPPNCTMRAQLPTGNMAVGSSEKTGVTRRGHVHALATHRSSSLGYRVVVFSLAVAAYFYYTMSQHASGHEDQVLDDNKSIFLPYVYKFESKATPQVRATINGTEFELPMDTGSTGLLIGAPMLPDVGPDEGTPAYEYLTSSGILYNGRLVDLPITFHGSDGAYATTTAIPVLVVDKSFVCRWYDPNVDTFDCPKRAGQPDPKPRDTSQIMYMGVGFGRNRPGDGQPTAIPRGNPFLNIESMNGQILTSSTVRAGYTVSTEGVHLGLTEANTRGYAWTDLEPGTTHKDDPRDWAMPRMSFSINGVNDGEAQNTGAALIDTGIAQMYIRSEPGFSIPNITIRNPNPDGYAEWVRRAKPGTVITVGFPSLDVDAAKAAAKYAFVVGEKTTGLEPREVIPERQRKPAFVNTGRNFLFGFSIAFDAVGGRFGFLASSPSNNAASTRESTSSSSPSTPSASPGMI